MKKGFSLILAYIFAAPLLGVVLRYLADHYDVFVLMSGRYAIGATFFFCLTLVKYGAQLKTLLTKRLLLKKEKRTLILLKPGELTLWMRCQFQSSKFLTAMLVR